MPSTTILKKSSPKKDVRHKKDKKAFLAQTNSKPLKDIPSEVVLEITGQCNLRCKQCTNAIQEPYCFSFNKIKKVLDDAKKLGVSAVRFTGGEPLLNLDLPKMLSYAKTHGFYVLLNTNATLITPAYLRLFQRTVDNVLVSLQGFSDASDQAITQSNFPFAEKIKNTFLLRSYVPTLRIGTVISQTLLDNLPRYATLIKKMSIDTWELFRPMSSKNSEKAQITANDYRKLALALLKIQASGLNATIANALPFCLLPNLKISALTMLGATADDGHSRLVLDGRGFFKPSYFIDKNLGKDILSAWKHPFIKKIRAMDYLPTACKKCAYLSQCRGGSRSLAKKINSSYFAPDPLFNEKNASLAQRTSAGL